MRGLILLLLLSGFALKGCSGLSPQPQAVVEDGSLYRMTLPATATVLKDGQIAGAGAFISQQGHFLTAAHVVYKAKDRVELLLPGGRVVRARVVATDLGQDLSVLRVDDPATVPTRVLGFAEQIPPPGTPIYLIGAPTMLVESMLPGRVARGRVGFNYLGDRKSYVRSLVVAADAPRGSSGGCWVDGRGRIVGVQSAFIGDHQGSLGLSFITPVSASNALIQNRKDQPAATLGARLVGLRTQSHAFSKRFPPGAAGAVVHRIFEGGPIAKAGIPKDHMITHANGKPIAGVDALYTLVRQAKPGDVMRLDVLSPDKHEQKVYRVALDALRWD